MDVSGVDVEVVVVLVDDVVVLDGIVLVVVVVGTGLDLKAAPANGSADARAAADV